MNLFDHPFIVVDCETTGITGKPDGFVAHVVEIGACVVTETGEVLDSLAFFVRQSPEVLDDPRAARAFEITGIDRQQVVRDGLPLEIASKVFALWVAAHRNLHNASEIRAFNQAFDFVFLRAPEWNTFSRARVGEGECLMLAAMEIMGPAGALPPAPRWAQDKGQPWKWPRVAEAVAFFNGKGHDIAWGANSAHRALEDCLKEAALAVAIEKERFAARQQLHLPLEVGDEAR
ncbi:hypothetical protein CMI47_17920 [Candidatus Pacearchaeota archaeon]|nr:hypothetical protein [Candidatus Pacearchaeota archaeon]|tara:strand:+ start:1179 stop:1874 length:696 start_codon:yes stop_codon:yes gene_type:complete